MIHTSRTHSHNVNTSKIQLEMPGSNNRNFSGSLINYNLFNYIDVIFRDFFIKHNISKDSNSHYKNKYTELFIGASDHDYISLTFRKVGKDEWYKFSFYLEASLSINDIPSLVIGSSNFTYSNLDEFAEAFVKFYAELAEKYLNEPFENNFTWEKKYNILVSDFALHNELYKIIPFDPVLYKMYFDRNAREEWRLMAKEKLGLNG